MDKTYKERMALRASLLKEYPDVVLGVHDDADPRIRRAVGELYSFVMGTYLPTRYPTMFSLSARPSCKSVFLENKVTGKTYPVEMGSQPILKALEILGQTVDEEFLILLPDDARGQDSDKESEERYFLAAYTAYFPSGFDTRTKLGLRLAAIHDPVPGYKEKLERSMDRFFARVEVGKVVARVNWSITTKTGLFAAFGGVHGSTAAGKEEIEPGMLDVDSVGGAFSLLGVVAYADAEGCRRFSGVSGRRCIGCLGARRWSLRSIRIRILCRRSRTKDWARSWRRRLMG
jgi:hypothetical protein